jgi:flagellar export protein FliJ
VAVFKFRLASVLRYRERRQEEKEREMRELLETRQRMEEAIRALEREWLGAEEALARGEGEIVPAVDLRLYADYARRTAARLKERRAALTKFSVTIAEKRRELLEAVREVKTLEQLRARMAEKHRQGENRAEQQFGDEIGQRKFADPRSRKKNPG